MSLKAIFKSLNKFYLYLTWSAKWYFVQIYRMNGEMHNIGYFPFYKLLVFETEIEQSLKKYDKQQNF